MHHTTLLRRRPEVLRLPAATRPRDESGAATAEYATVTGAAVGFGALLWKFLTSDLGQKLLEHIFSWITSLIG